MEGITLFISIIFIVFGILQIILFFKMWGMTNDVEKLKGDLNKLTRHFCDDSEIIYQRYPNYSAFTDLTLEFRNWFLQLSPRKYTSINEGNIGAYFDKIKEAYKLSFGVDNVFEVDLDSREDSIAEIKNNLNKKDPSFTEFNKKTGKGIPHAILNTHFIDFIRSYRIVNEK